MPRSVPSDAVSITERVKLLVEAFFGAKISRVTDQLLPATLFVRRFKMTDRSQKYFRVDYDARLVDGTPFRPNTWMVLDDVRSIEGAAMRVRALHRREAKLRTGMLAL